MKGYCITERDFATAVEDLLARFNWKWCHYRPARTERGWRTALSGDAGLPDYIAARTSPPALLIFELKREKGRVTPEQAEWIEVLKACGVDVRLWRPSDMGEITEILSGGRLSLAED